MDKEDTFFTFTMSRWCFMQPYWAVLLQLKSVQGSAIIPDLQCNAKSSHQHSIPHILVSFQRFVVNVSLMPNQLLLWSSESFLTDHVVTPGWGHRPLTVQLRPPIHNGIDGDTQQDQKNYTRHLKHLLNHNLWTQSHENTAYLTHKHCKCGCWWSDMVNKVIIILMRAGSKVQ